jgi:hypothetical protein
MQVCGQIKADFRRVLKEFYRAVFHKKLCWRTDEPLGELEDWVAEYERWCYWHDAGEDLH